MTSREKALALATEVAGKQGMDIQILDLREVSSFTDFFVIATGTSDRHLRTLADSVVETARSFGDRPLGVEGAKTGRWVLVDLGDVVAHVFREEAREFYGLERLWGQDEPQAVEAAQ